MGAYRILSWPVGRSVDYLATQASKKQILAIFIKILQKLKL
jgi:hypothetical protein